MFALKQLPQPLEKIPAGIDFDTADKKFKCQVNLDSKNVNFADGIEGSIKMLALGPGVEAVYGCLIRKEDIALTSTMTKSRSSCLT